MTASHFREANFRLQHASVVRLNTMTTIKHVSEIRCWTSYHCKRQKWPQINEVVENLAHRRLRAQIGSSHDTFSGIDPTIGTHGDWMSIRCHTSPSNGLGLSHVVADRRIYKILVLSMFRLNSIFFKFLINLLWIIIDIIFR